MPAKASARVGQTIVEVGRGWATAGTIALSTYLHAMSDLGEGRVSRRCDLAQSVSHEGEIVAHRIAEGATR